MTIRELIPDFDATTIIYLGTQVVIVVILIVFLQSRDRKNQQAAEQQQAQTKSYIERELEFLQRAEQHMKRVEEKLDHIASLMGGNGDGAT